MEKVCGGLGSFQRPFIFFPVTPVTVSDKEFDGLFVHNAGIVVLEPVVVPAEEPVTHFDGFEDRHLVAFEVAEPDRPVLLDHFLEQASEVDVDAVADGERVVICGIMEHIEEAGVHSGDSMAVLPPFLLSRDQHEDIREYTRLLAGALNVKGLINIQFAVMFDTLYVIEVNPRASRTVPFVSKATGVPLAKVAARIMAGPPMSMFSIANSKVQSGRATVSANG